MLLSNLSSRKIYLVSKSPRRASLLQSMGIQFEVVTSNVDESYEDSLAPTQVAEYLSQIKLSGIDMQQYDDKSIFITCDTIVVVDDQILGKPKDKADAVRMLEMLSEREHQVITGVTVATKSQQITSHRSTNVVFDTLSSEEIEYYVNTYKPMDKAGAYGVQEWIGCIGINAIDGSFYNVMGLPTKLLWDMLKEILK